MSQAKKSVYDLYSTMLSKSEKLIAKNFGPRVNSRHKLGQTLSENPWMRPTLEVSIYIEDYFWEFNGKHVIFPESADVIDNLMKAKFEVESSEGFALPFKSLVVAMPTGYRNNGVLVPSFLASYARNDRAEEKLFPFLDALREPHSDFVFEASDPSTNVLVVQYRDALGAWAKVSITDRDMPRILKCRNAEELSQEIGLYERVLDGAIDCTPEDRKIQFFALKLVASMGVYCLSTGGKRLKDGFPGTLMPKLMGHDGSGGMRLSTLQNAAKADKESPESHYRTWHFRQLRDARFYKGEYQSMTPGSRYVFVSDAVVGQAVEPSTMT